MLNSVLPNSFLLNSVLLKAYRLEISFLSGIVIRLCLASVLFFSAVLQADDRDDAKRIYQRIAGVPPSEANLTKMADFLKVGNGAAATAIALEDDDFYNVTLKNFITPWTNEAQSVFAPLNDYTATVIGIIRDDVDFREVLSSDIIYVGKTAGLAPYSNTNNDHYLQLESRDISLKNDLVQKTQSSVTGLPATATAGILTTRAAAQAFFIDGTNRAMLRFTLMNHLCRDLEEVKDISLSPDRIRQDVSRSPGGDSRIFLNTCIGCHTGMDPLTQAFAYYNFSYDKEADPDAINGQLSYTPGVVQAKYLINNNNFPDGYITPNDHWDNYWRVGQNKLMNWSASLPGGGDGAKSMGQELAHSEVFARCQVEKVFTAVCLRDPVNTTDRAKVTAMLGNFKTNYKLKSVFSDAALFCKGDAP